MTHFRFRAIMRVPLADQMVSTRELGIVQVTLGPEQRGACGMLIQREDGEVVTARYFPRDEKTGLGFRLTPERIEIPCSSLVDRRERPGVLILTPVEEA